MAERGFTGISFPFRIGVKGGVVTSTTGIMDVQHIVEAMTQILHTRPMERCMEYHFKSEIDSNVFEPNDVSIKTLLAYQVKKALAELEDRITVDYASISLITSFNFPVLVYILTYIHRMPLKTTNIGIHIV